jgi:hypothetical protein
MTVARIRRRKLVAAERTHWANKAIVLWHARGIVDQGQGSSNGPHVSSRAKATTVACRVASINLATAELAT